MTDQAFEEYVKEKYAESQAIHHYEKTQSSGATTGNGSVRFLTQNRSK